MCRQMMVSYWFAGSSWWSVEMALACKAMALVFIMLCHTVSALMPVTQITNSLDKLINLADACRNACKKCPHGRPSLHGRVRPSIQLLRGQHFYLQWHASDSATKTASCLSTKATLPSSSPPSQPSSTMQFGSSWSWTTSTKAVHHDEVFRLLDKQNIAIWILQDSFVLMPYSTTPSQIPTAKS